jgi:hypothetical protein
MSKYLDLIHISTNTRVNDQWWINHPMVLESIQQLPPTDSFKNFVDTTGIMDLVDPLYQQAFLHVVTETVYNYPTTFISEKTIKPIISKRPFVMVGPVGSIARLQRLGFQTFSDFWSEEYDTITNCEDRILAVVDLIDFICSNSLDQLQVLCNKMQKVLDYNYNYYINDFKSSELSKFEQACINNLKPRYN